MTAQLTTSAGRPESVPPRGKIFFLAGLVVVLSFGWIVFPFLIYKKVEQPIQFSHIAHTGDNVGMKCEDCHNYDSSGRFLGIPKIRKCAECHTKPMGVSAEDRKLAEDYVRPGREINWAVYSRQPENVYFPHAVHVKEAGLKCQTCHFGQSTSSNLRPAMISRLSGYSLDIFGQNLFNAPYTPSRGMRMDDCSDCHKKSGVAESCVDCHK